MMIARILLLAFLAAFVARGAWGLRTIRDVATVSSQGHLNSADAVFERVFKIPDGSRRIAEKLAGVSGDIAILYPREAETAAQSVQALATLCWPRRAGIFEVDATTGRAVLDKVRAARPAAMFFVFVAPPPGAPAETLCNGLVLVKRP